MTPITHLPTPVPPARKVAAVVLWAALVLLARPVHAQTPLASGELRILGARLTVSPASPCFSFRLPHRPLGDA